MPTIEEQVRDLICDQLGLDKDEVELGSTLDIDLAMDSIDVVELVMAIEEVFSVELPDETWEQFKRVRDVVNWLEERKITMKR